MLPLLVASYRITSFIGGLPILLVHAVGTPLCLLTNFPCLLVKSNLFWVFNVHVCLWNFWFVLVKSAISLRNPNRCLLNPNLCWFKSPHSCVRFPEGINQESIDIPFISSHFKIPWISQIFHWKIRMISPLTSPVYHSISPFCLTNFPLPQSLPWLWTWPI